MTYIMETREKGFIFIDLLIDMCILNTAVFLSAVLFPVVLNDNSSNISISLLCANFSCLISYLLFSKNNLFLRDGFIVRFNYVTKRIFLFLIVSSIIEISLFPTNVNRMFFLEYIFLFYVGQLFFVWLRYQYSFIKINGHLSTNQTIIIGSNPTSYYLRQIIDNNPMLGYKFVGFVNDNEKYDPQVLGTTKDLSTLIDEHQIHMVFVTFTFFDESFKGKEYLRICNKKGIRIRFIPETVRSYKHHLDMESLSKLTILNPQEIPLDSSDARLLKRMFDIVFSSIVILLLLSWLFPIIALLIKLTSKGPVLFIQKRTCINNKTFNCYKFRSMKVNDQADTKQATDYDSRITQLGKFLRKSNIDELPQFVNVLLGHMSISGPRPHMLKHTSLYSELIDIYQVRHYVKPGITGWAQVNGYRGETDELWKMEKRVEYDIEYIENWNFWWDIKIIILTVTNMKSLIQDSHATSRLRFYNQNSNWQLHKLNE